MAGELIDDLIAAEKRLLPFAAALARQQAHRLNPAIASITPADTFKRTFRYPMSTRRPKSLQRAFPWRQPCLEALSRDPHVGRACKAAGISRNSMYAHLRRDTRFRRQWERARDAAWEARMRQDWDSVMAELERRGWFARFGIAKLEYPSKQKRRQLAALVESTD